MDDVMMFVYDALMDDPYIAEHASGRIKFYEYPDTGDVTGAYIVIDPLDAPMPEDFADNTWLTLDYMFQIDVWTKNRGLTRKLSSKVMEVMWNLNFGQYGGGGDEWDRDTGIYRQIRRFKGKVYRNIIEGEKRNGEKL